MADIIHASKLFWVIRKETQSQINDMPSSAWLWQILFMRVNCSELWERKHRVR